MTDLQVWTLIGVFAAAMFGVTGIVSISFTRSLQSGFEAVGYRFDALEARLTGRIDSLDRRLTGQIESLDHRLSARIDTVEARLSAKIELLDRDISVIAERAFPDESS